LDSFIHRLNTSSDEKEIFQEISSKNKDKVSPIQQEKKIIEKPASPVQQTTANNIFKSLELPLMNPDTIENLLGLLITLYKTQQAAVEKIREDETLSNLLLRPSPYEVSKLFRQTSSPEGLDRSSLGLVTPSIRKSVSIIVNFS